MIAILAGGTALVVILVFLQAFAGAEIGTVTKGMRYAGAVALLTVAVALAALDRVGMAVLAGSVAWGLFTGGRAWPGGWSFQSGGGTFRQRERKGDETTSRSGMSRTEALNLLGLEEGASQDAIVAAHKRLILQNHPDKGGTSYLASKINEARDVLLKNR